jgi:hypothetical protein
VTLGENKMQILGFLMLFLCSLGSTLYWVVCLRPFLHSRGLTPITGANWGLSALGDWQMCSEYADKTKDLEAKIIAKRYVYFWIGSVLGGLMILLSPIIQK